MRVFQPLLLIFIFGLMTPAVLAQPPGPPDGQRRGQELERQLRNHPQQDEERVDLLLSNPPQPGTGRGITEFKERAREALTILKNLNYKPGKARAYEALAATFDPFESADSILYYYTKAWQIFNETGDHQRAMAARLGMGRGLSFVRRYSEAQEIFVEVLDYFEQQEDHYHTGKVYDAIGILYMEQKEPGIAVTYFEKSLEAFTSSGHQAGMIRALKDLALAHNLTRNPDKALTSVNRAIDLAEKNRAPVVPLYVVKGRFLLREGKLESAEEIFRNSLNLDRENTFLKDRAVAESYLAEIDFKQGDFAEAKVHAEEALRLDDLIKSGLNRLRRKNRLLTLLALTEKELGNADVAVSYLLESKALIDSLNQAENLRAISDIQTKYETEKKEQEILLLQLEKKAKQRLYISIIIGIVSVCITGGIFFWQTAKRKEQERKLKLQSVQREMEQYGVLIAEKDSLITGIINKLKTVSGHLNSQDSRKELRSLMDSLRNNLDLVEDEKQLFQRIEQVNAGFFHKLEEKAGNLSNREKRLAPLVSMGLSNKEIGNILGINPRSAMQAKFRLKKKLNLPPETDLQEYLKAMVD